MTSKDLYSEWLEKFVHNGIPFEMDYHYGVIKFDSYDIYTPFTYSFTFHMGLSSSGELYNYKFKQKDYKLFANLFFIEGWEEELKYQLTYYQDRKKIKKPNPNFGDNYGEIKYYVKPWVDHVTFQGYRTIVQFKYDKFCIFYNRKEKLKKLNCV